MSERMNPEVKAKWLAALRSGQYKRGTGYLHRSDDCMCPYGVLCDLAARSGVPVSVEQLDSGTWTYDSKKGMPPWSVLNWAGLSSAVIALDYGGEAATIPLLNDNEGLDFLAIADLIEVQL